MTAIRKFDKGGGSGGAGITLTVESYTGANATGSEGTGRTLTTTGTPVFISVNNSLLNYTVDYTVAGTTITFLKNLFNDMAVTVWTS